MLNYLTGSGRKIIHACLVISSFLPHQGLGQKTSPDAMFTFETGSVTLGELLDIVEKKTGASFSYNPKKINTGRKVAGKVFVQRSLPQILDEFAKDFGLEFSEVEQKIIVKPSRSKTKEARTVTISGTVKDEKNGEALIGATLFVEELATGTITNPFGFFSITVPEGMYTVSCSFIGYGRQRIPVDLHTSQEQNFRMAEEAPLLQEIVVTNTLPDIVTDIRSGSTNVRPSAIEERPAFFGENDVVKSLESLPGIKLHSDGSTFYYVRGGDRDQNLVLVDDAPIYNPSHMLGIFSTIIPDAVNDMTVYRGDMPASMGGRLSSVLDIRTKKGNDQHFQAWGSVSPVSTKLGIEGPFKKDASSFLISTRFSRLKWIAQLARRNVERFNFYDLTGKTNIRLNKSNRVFFSFYSGADNYFGENNGLAWSNNAGTIRWNHLFSDRLFLNTTVAASGYDYFLYTDVGTNTRWNSHISNFNIKTDFSYYLRPGNELTFGAGLNGFSFNPGNLLSDSNIPDRLSLSVRNAVEFVLYGNHEIQLTERLGLSYGLRLSSWTNTGESFEFVFDNKGDPIDTLFFQKGENYNTYNNAEPRMTISYSLNENSSLKANVARNIQNVHLISNSISPFTSLEVWLPSSLNIKPQKSTQYVLGYYRNLPSAGSNVSVEGYYKKMYNQIDYTAHAETLLNPLLERELRFGDAWSYGIEFLAKKDEGRLRGLAGYTFSRVKRKFPGINQGRVYNAFSDRPHQLNMMLSYDLSLRWNAGLNWILTTGAPFSSPLGFYHFNGEEVPVYGQKNNDRLPDYHRLDISATLRLNRNPEKNFRHFLGFSIYNFYARKNTLFINYNKKQVADSEFRIPVNLLEANRVTSRYYLFRFTPSISYNFKWK